jgi:hypothetical protein
VIERAIEWLLVLAAAVCMAIFSALFGSMDDQ